MEEDNIALMLLILMMFSLLPFFGLLLMLFDVPGHIKRRMELKDKQRSKLIHLPVEILSDEELWIVGHKIDKKRLKRGSLHQFQQASSDDDESGEGLRTSSLIESKPDSRASTGARTLSRQLMLE